MMVKYRFDYFCSGCSKNSAFCDKNCFTDYKYKRYYKGEAIAYLGNDVAELAMLVSGKIAIHTVLESGFLLVTKQHIAPHPIGAVALFSKERNFRIDVVAEEDCEVIYIKKDAIENHIMLCRIFMQNYLSYITTRIDILAGHLNILTHKNLRAKLSYYILTCSKGDFFIFDKKICELALYFCVERPSLSRAISQFVEDGVISYNGGKGKILNFVELRNMVM